MTAPPRTQLVIRFAPETHPAHAIDELRKAGWDAWEQNPHRFIRRDVVIEAWTSRVRGGKLEVADAAAAQARELLRDFSVVSVEAHARNHSPMLLPAWKVVAEPTLSKGDAAIVAERTDGYLFFGPLNVAQTRVARLFEGTGVDAGSWSLQRYESWSEQMRRRETLIAILIALGAAAVGMVVGFLLTSSSTVSTLAALYLAAGGAVLMVVIASVGARLRQRLVKALALGLLLVGVAAALCGPTLVTTRSGQWWVSPGALTVVIVALVVQAFVTSRTYARMRLATSRLPVTVVLTALGLTAFVLVLNLPITLFYEAAGELQLVGTASWGTVIGTGWVFAAAVVLAAVSAWWGLSRWRSYATLFRARLLLGVFTTGMFAFFAFLTLGASITDGQLARDGAYGTGPHLVPTYAVCIADPRSPNEHTPLWLLGTSGRTTVLVDRSRMTGAKPAGEFPHDVDINRPLQYVDAHQSC